ncbi:unnamed protein product [Acanthoscelides obtectus]|uniref:Uncharacterized protein n=1 Tax=Acanthoscelides obtectus TaxID=200917 RepID=A0A9P0Q4D2_ACAOB|nr:unnamed protein product [Acanthoscelides obtectus]CAK1626001.1 Gustatory and odorant receptor 21a [Acanthoscelides obtectus]
MNCALWYINCRAIGNASAALADVFQKVYGFTSEAIENGVTLSFKELGLLVDAVYCMTLLYIFCDCSHKASENIAERVQTTLLNINLSQVDSHTAKENAATTRKDY